MCVNAVSPVHIRRRRLFFGFRRFCPVRDGFISRRRIYFFDRWWRSLSFRSFRECRSVAWALRAGDVSFWYAFLFVEARYFVEVPVCLSFWNPVKLSYMVQGSRSDIERYLLLFATAHGRLTSFCWGWIFDLSTIFGIGLRRHSIESRLRCIACVFGDWGVDINWCQGYGSGSAAMRVRESANESLERYQECKEC